MRHEFDASAGRYVEGAFFYARLEQRGRLILERRFGRSSTMLLRIRGGVYDIKSYARSYPGFCGEHLGNAHGWCTARVWLPRATTTRVLIRARAGVPCRIAILGRH